jgi:hypothetical protein
MEYRDTKAYLVDETPMATPIHCIIVDGKDGQVLTPAVHKYTKFILSTAATPNLAC